MKHKKPDMYNVKNKLCTEENCLKAAYYGFESKKPLFCYIHKQENSFNVVQKLCENENCHKRPCYGLIWKKPLSCKEHKMENYINVISSRCNKSGCNKRPCYGIKNKKPIYCAKHADKMKMKNNISKKCTTIGCETIPIFGLPGQNPTKCYQHKTLKMIDVKNKRCEENGCNIQASYGYKKNKKVLRCATHKLKNMVDLVSRLCTYSECSINATFGKVNGKPTRCFTHKDKNMINLKKKICIFNKCKIGASFGYEGEKSTHCEKHKTKNMISFYKIKCAFMTCNISPSFGYELKKPLYCVKHKEEDMVDVVSKKCEFPQCSINASFGIKKRRFCKEHALSSMINLSSKYCIFEDCTTTACFNYPNKKSPTHCAKHKEFDMIDITKRYCSKCRSQTRYGIPGNLSTKCAVHKLPGMIRFPTRRCVINRCKNIAIYGLTEQKHCEMHKEKNEYNLVENECKSCGLLMILSENQLCGYCDPTMIKNHILHKQRIVKKFLDDQNIKYTAYDKTIESCGRERPDFLFDCGTHYVILEVDEHQHNLANYNKDNLNCETIRMRNIAESLGMKTVFIRYNPDKFKTNSEVHNPTTNYRHKILSQCLKSFINKKYNKLHILTVVKLFYDNCKPNRPRISILVK